MDRDTHERKKKGPSTRPIIPNRMTGDNVSRIDHPARKNRYDHSSSWMAFVVADQAAMAVAVAHIPGRHFELNTPWVELLIHEQQMKLASVAP
jgi:hypothetical protein